MPPAISNCFGMHEAVAVQLIVEFRTWIGVGNGHLNGFRIDFLGEINCALDRVSCLSRKSNDEVAVDPNSHFLAILRESASLFDCCTLFDVLQNLWITGFKPDNEEARSSVRHGLQRFIVAVHACRTRPPKPQGLQLCANIEDAVFADVERIVVEEKFLCLREQAKRLPDFPSHVFARANSPGMSGKRLRPQTKRAERRTAARRVKSHIRMKQEWNVVSLDRKVAFVNLGRERQLIEIFRLKLRPRRVQMNAAIVSVTRTCNLTERLTLRELDDGVVEFA